MRKNFLPGLATLLFAGVCAVLLLAPIQAAAQRTVISPAEEEQKNLIVGLYNDGLYDMAREEAVAYLETYPKGLFRAEIVYTVAQVTFCGTI